VVAIGGGSVIDAGKAISAMIHAEGSVELYLEEVGAPSRHPGSKVPFIAVPTTAGTGSEATKNAVLSRTGPGGFKRSLRHDGFVPDVAIVDPVLALTCPRAVTAACGMDALTQLLESFVSTRATPFTDDMCRSGLGAVAGSLLPVCGDGGADPVHRSRMAYAAMLSGITLSNAGLGVVHGIASELGAAFGVPHGVACGTVLAGATEATVLRLLASAPEGPALKKYAEAGEILCGRTFRGPAEGAHALVELLVEWTHGLDIPRLGRYGMKQPDKDAIAARSGNKNNPAQLTAREIGEILGFRI
jgi:alcohol dehydrogenase class IV